MVSHNHDSRKFYSAKKGADLMKTFFATLRMKAVYYKSRRNVQMHAKIYKIKLEMLEVSVYVLAMFQAGIKAWKLTNRVNQRTQKTKSLLGRKVLVKTKKIKIEEQHLEKDAVCALRDSLADLWGSLIRFLFQRMRCPCPCFWQLCWDLYQRATAAMTFYKLP